MRDFIEMMSLRKKIIFPFAITWMKREDIIRRGESQIQKGKYHMFHLYVGPKDAEYIEAENRMCAWWENQTVSLKAYKVVVTLDE